jgi:hypothetical protein
LASPSRGLARFLETEQAVVLDKRLELAAVHKNGAEFPVELTITRIGLPGPPTFADYLRDITDRKCAEDELRGSRARLVEVAERTEARGRRECRRHRRRRQPGGAGHTRARPLPARLSLRPARSSRRASLRPRIVR